MRQLKNGKGFTLIEVLIVIIIIAVLAGLAIPLLVAQVEKSRNSEAWEHLGSTRSAALRFFAENNTYVGIPNSCTNLDYDPNANVGNQTIHFSYRCSNQAGLPTPTITITATRNGRDGGDGVGTLTLDQSGVRGGTRL